MAAFAVVRKLTVGLLVNIKSAMTIMTPTIRPIPAPNHGMTSSDLCSFNICFLVLFRASASLISSGFSSSAVWYDAQASVYWWVAYSISAFRKYPYKVPQ